MNAYPQELRSAYAAAYAAQGYAIFSLVDARGRLAGMSLRTVNGRCPYTESQLDEARAEVARLEAVKDVLVFRSREAHRVLKAAEDIYFGERVWVDRGRGNGEWV
jgi:hypothetical protein